MENREVDGRRSQARCRGSLPGREEEELSWLDDRWEDGRSQVRWRNGRSPGCPPGGGGREEDGGSCLLSLVGRMVTFLQQLLLLLLL